MATSPRPEPAGSEGGRDWETLASGLGRVLGSLEDLDMASFALDDVVVLTVSRDGPDVWIVARGPGDQVAPVALSPDQVETLTRIGFRPPLADEAERGPQRDNWWLRLVLPAHSEHLELIGHRIAAAAREVYHADRPAAIEWFGMALSTHTRRALSTLALTKSEFQREAR